MKTSCPACGQHLAYGDDLAGTTAPCPKCGADVSFPNLTTCPDCGAEVSRRAEVCPRCAAPLASRAPAKVWENTTSLVVGALLILLVAPAGIGLAAGLPEGQKVFGWLLSACAVVGAGLLWSKRWRIRCPNCDHEGEPRVAEGAGCLFTLLLLVMGEAPWAIFSAFHPLAVLGETALILFAIGLIPPLICGTLARHRFYCPVCGREGFR